MEKRRVAILSIKKNEITIKLKKKHRSYFGLSIFIVLAFILCFSFGTTEMKSIGVSMSQIYNPVSSLYNDNSDVVFTSNDVLSFSVPLMGANYEITSDGTIVFEVSSSIMVKASESGVIQEVGTTNNGIKYIKIKHAGDYWTLIENVEIVGVAENEIVKKGQDIATAKIGANVYFQIFNGDVKISNIKLDLNKITWES